MKRSFRAKMILMLFGTVVMSVIITLVLNTVLLKPYYKKMKEQSLTASFATVCQLDFNESDILTKLESIEERENVQILIIDYKRRVFFCSNKVSDSLFLPVNGNDGIQSGEQWFSDWLIPDGSGDDSYKIFSTKPNFGTPYNSALSASYLSLYAKAIIDYHGADLPFYIIINAPLEVIEDSTEIANRFALLVGTVILLVGGIVTIILSNRIVAPVVLISQAAQKMSHFDFNEKVRMKRNDEIGQIAGSINTLSYHLESKIKELSVANEQLKKELEHRVKVDNMRRDFISDVSHELKTPLAIILGYCEGLQLNVNSDEKEYYCSIIEAEAMRMNKLAERLLKLAELESGEVPLDVSDFDLAGLGENRLSKLAYLLEERGVSSEFFTEGCAYVKGDRDRIEEVVNNLLTNAKNHTPDNGVIRLTVKEESNGVYCEVYNSGSHIPQESLERIWDSFYKVDKARTHSYGGSGLGLKIVSTILQSHNADYGVENTEDGVKFWFRLEKSEIDLTGDFDYE